MIDKIKFALLDAGANIQYLNRYINIINKSTLDNDIYEFHHILPRSIFPEYVNSKWNIVRLSIRQHYIAHWILYAMFGKTGPMQQALWFMTHTRGLKLNSKTYEELKRKRIEYSKVVMSNAMKGKASYKDKNNKVHHLHTNDPKIKILGLSHITSGYTTFVNRVTGQILHLNINDPILNDLNVVHINLGIKRSEDTKNKMKGRVVVTDTSGQTFKTSVNDPLYLNGTYRQANCNKTNVIIDGMPKKIDSDDYKTGNFKHQNTDRVDVILPCGKITKIDKDDIRLKTGEATIYCSDNKREAAKRNMTKYNKSCAGKRWLTSPDGKEQMYNGIDVEHLLTKGYVLGRKSTKFHSCLGVKTGKSFYNNGISEMLFSPGDVPKGWVKGRLKRYWVFNNDKSAQVLAKHLDEYLTNGWIKGRPKNSI